MSPTSSSSCFGSVPSACSNDIGGVEQFRIDTCDCLERVIILKLPCRTYSILIHDDGTASKPSILSRTTGPFVHDTSGSPKLPVGLHEPSPCGGALVRMQQGWLRWSHPMPRNMANCACTHVLHHEHADNSLAFAVQLLRHTPVGEMMLIHVRFIWILLCSSVFRESA